MEAISHLIETVRRLRAPDGCPWDRAQTHQSLRQYLIEESYEVLDVLDQINTTDDLKNERIRDALREELGDVLLQVLLHSEMASEQGAFNIHDVAEGLDKKLIHRHPHVFGDTKAHNVDSALQKWEIQKAAEKAKTKENEPAPSVLSGVPRNLPSLQRAARVIDKATKVGFQWKDMHGPLEKVEEEFKELKDELLKLEQQGSSPELQKRIEGELGDLLFSVCNLAQMVKQNPEDALRSTLGRFESRFKHVENRLREQGRTPQQATLDEMDVFWNEAKRQEKEHKT